MDAIVRKFQSRLIVAGEAAGEAVAADEPLSFWGGLDPKTGEIIDRRHPLSGELTVSRVLVMPSGKGSCSASGVLLEAIRNGTAPVGILISELDPVVGLGAILGEELCGKSTPVALVSDEFRRTVNSGDQVTIERNGIVTVTIPQDVGTSPK